MEYVVDGKYKLTAFLGRGSFGQLYAGINLKSKEQVAIKMESLKVTTPQLEYEAQVYKNLKNGCKYFYWPITCSGVPECLLAWSVG